ncbi:MAG TPA: SRPBCC family protein [Thermoleophilaceae bacterium]
MTKVSAARRVVLPPDEAEALWLDVSRWATFIEGFAHAVEQDESWPAEGSKLVWVSLPDGRGRVTEKVTSRGMGHLTTRLVEDSLVGIQSITFRPGEDGGTLVELSLEYELNPTTVWRSGGLGVIVNALFIRRAMADSLARTLRRFATEAAEQQAL